MKKLFFILTLLFSISSSAFSIDLKVMSWNVYFDDYSGEDRYPEIIKTIAKQNPDVVCLQEATDKFIKSLILSQNFDAHTLININGSGSYKNIILTKLKISSNGIIHLPTNMNRYAPYIKTEINGKSTVVVNLHLDSMMEDTEIRIKQLKKVVSSTSDDDNVILCGDLNFGDDDKENTFINKHFKDTGSNNKKFTYDIEKNILAKKTKFTFEKSRRLDHILISDNIKSENYTVLITPYSDHYAIISNLTTD